MKEILFVIKVLVLTIVVVIVLQFEYKGQSLESRASFMFGSSETIPWIRKESNRLAGKFGDKFQSVKKVNNQNPL